MVITLDGVMFVYIHDYRMHRHKVDYVRTMQTVTNPEHADISYSIVCG